MTEPEKDTIRASNAALAILDGRDMKSDRGNIFVTLEHLVATILLVAMNGDQRKAAAMLNEALVPGVEQRLAFFAPPETET